MFLLCNVAGGEGKGVEKRMERRGSDKTTRRRIETVLRGEGGGGEGEEENKKGEMLVGGERG